MTRLQNSIAHRKYTRSNRKYTRSNRKQALSMIDLLKVRNMALDLANEEIRTPPSILQRASRLYGDAKKEIECH